METDEALRRLEQLWERLAAFEGSVRARYPEALTCHAGCDDCCRTRFSVTRLEARAVRGVLRGLDGPLRERIAERARSASPACPFLESNGRCAVYEARPVICRTHGLALRLREEGGPRRLPVLDACPKNFRGLALDTLAPSAVLEQSTVSTVLAALEAFECRTRGLEAGPREELSSVAAEEV